MLIGITLFIGLIFSVLSFINIRFLGEFNSSRLFSILTVGLFEIFIVFLLFRLATVPGIFIDEGNAMYESWSIAHYGVDSNLMHSPIYFQSFQGQGQSVLYAYLAVPFLKLFGYHLLSFRIPLIILSFISSLLVFRVLIRFTQDIKSAFLILMPVLLSPWILTVSRWGMDCNVSSFVLMIGICLIVLSTGHKESNVKSRIQLLAGVLLLGLTAYAYNVAWIYLPFLVVGIFVLLWLYKLASIKKLAVVGMLLVIELIPIMLFAVRSNIAHLNVTKHFLSWTLPALPVGRTNSSFISFHGNVTYNVFLNIIAGIKMFLNGSDGLPWNSVTNFGPYYVFVLPFFILGLIQVYRKRNFISMLLIAMLAAEIPTLMIVTPNYNHFMFLHFPVLILVGVGVSTLGQFKGFITSIVVTYGIMFGMFTLAYFHEARIIGTGWTPQTGREVQSLHSRKYSKVYFASQQPFFLIMIRDVDPVSPYIYQSSKDNPYKRGDPSINKYLNYENIDAVDTKAKLRHNSLVLIDTREVDQYTSDIKEFRYIKTVTISGIGYREYDTSVN